MVFVERKASVLIDDPIGAEIDVDLSMEGHHGSVSCILARVWLKSNGTCCIKCTSSDTLHLDGNPVIPFSDPSVNTKLVSGDARRGQDTSSLQLDRDRGHSFNDSHQQECNGESPFTFQTRYQHLESMNAFG